MAVYEKDLPRTLRVMTRLVAVIEPLLNFRLNRLILTFFMRYIKLEKITKHLESTNLNLG
jgi:hypothetical protein